jgi:hypothetical protein
MSAIQPEAALVGASTNGTQVPDDVEDLVRSDDPEHVRVLLSFAVSETRKVDSFSTWCLARQLDL